MNSHQISRKGPPRLADHVLVHLGASFLRTCERPKMLNRSWQRVTRRKGFDSRCPRLRELLHRQDPHSTAVVPLAGRCKFPVVQTEGGAKFRLPLQKVSCSLAVKFVDLFNDSMEVVSARIVHGTVSSRSVETTKRYIRTGFSKTHRDLRK